ncbi:MAG: holo-ACP synthase [Gemmatimonadales bacterium]|jgi:holo-[acyl-carrier protein] synthase
MIPLGLGLDLIDVARVRRLLARKGERALARLLTEDERQYCVAQAEPARHVAGRLAAKEAAYKALTTDREAGWIGWREVEVVRGADGRPALELYGRATEAAGRLGVRSMMVSLTHSREAAAAVVLLLG